MVKHLVESLKTIHIPMKCENQKAITKFTKLMNTINKLEERMDNFRNEMSLFTKISQIIKAQPSREEKIAVNCDEISVNFNGNFPFEDQKNEREKSFNEISQENTNDPFISEDDADNTKEISGFYGEYAKKLAIGEKMNNFIEIYGKMKEKKAEHVDFFGKKIKEIMKEMSVFKELDNSRLLYLLRKIQKLKNTLIQLLPENRS